MFHDLSLNPKKINLIKATTTHIGSELMSFKLKSPKIDFHELFERKLKKGVAEGAYKKNIHADTLSNYYSDISSSQSLENLFFNYGSSKSYFLRNSKNSIRNLDDLKNPSNLWTLSRNNSVGRVYPNSNSVLLSGNLLISAKEGEGVFNTNLVSIKDPS
jgi:hypothetical protein